MTVPPHSRRPLRLFSLVPAAVLAGCAGQAETKSAELPDPLTPPITRVTLARADAQAAAQERASQFEGLAANLNELFDARNAKLAGPDEPTAESAPASVPGKPPAQAAGPSEAATASAPAPEPALGVAPAPGPAPSQTVATVAPATAGAPELASKAEPAAPETLAITRLALCSRVDGFGRYTLLPSDHFVAGRPNAVILYTELDHFTSAQVAGADGEPAWKTELAQAVTLHLDADGSRQFAAPEAVVTDVARAKRRDFYLVQRIDLPRNLSVGAYNLKVSVRDVAAGTLDEEVLRVYIVADPSAAGGAARPPVSGLAPSPVPGEGRQGGLRSVRTP